MIHDYLNFALKSMKHRGIRTLLSILGIVIGVGAIIALFAVSQGLENAITAQFEEIGADKIFVLPKTSIQVANIPRGFTDKDANALKSLPYFDYVESYYVDNGLVEFGNEKQFFYQINGFEAENIEDSLNSFGLKISKGRYFNKNEKFSVVIGDKVRKDIFDKEVRIGNKLTIKENKLEVVGILESIGNPDDDSAIIMTMDSVREIFDKEDEISMIVLDVKNGLNINSVGDKVKDRLKDVRNKDDFEVLTPEQTLETFTNILGVVQAALGGIAAISILVGAIVIMNSMFTSVLERTKEIGIMKAIGAKNSNIITLFLIESSIIGLIGGILGVILGGGIAKTVERIAVNSGWEILLININPSFIAFGLGFAVIIGSISGAYPAYKASKLSPVDALRD